MLRNKVIEMLISPDTINPRSSRTPKKTAAEPPTTAHIMVSRSRDMGNFFSDQRNRPKVNIVVGQGATP